MNALTGAGQCARLALRRDRWTLPLWIVSMAVVPLLYVASIKEIFPTAAQRQDYADTSAHSAGFVALYGPLYGASLGQLVAWRAGFIPVIIGLISILTVVRHTRVDEDAGRRELLGATAVGRHADLAAALAVIGAADLLLGALCALALVSQGLPVAGSCVLGIEFAVAGWVFAAVAAVAAQLAGSAGGARTLALATLGAAYVLRLSGDVSNMGSGRVAWLAWLSPFGGLQRMRPFAGERWWPCALALVLVAALTALAGALAARRDLGAGLLPTGRGPATAAAWLGSPLALAWRLQRGLFASWLAGFVALGVVLGGVANSITDLAGDNQQMHDIIVRMGGAQALTDSYLAGMASLLGLIAAGYAVQAVLKLQDEEASGRAEPLLSAPVSRLGWAGSHLVFAALGPAVVLAAGGLAMGLAYGLSAGDVPAQLPRVLGGALAQLPAVWTLAALAVALLGLRPRLAALSWGALGLCLLVLLVSGLRLSHWATAASPFTHVPRLPGGPFTATPLAALLAVALALAAAGLSGLRRRDMPVT